MTDLKYKYHEPKADNTFLGKSREEVVLLCDWYIGITEDFIDTGKVEEIKRMELLN